MSAGRSEFAKGGLMANRLLHGIERELAALGLMGEG